MQTKKRVVKSTLFGFQKNTVFVSYVPKKNKSVVLVSTLHDTGEIDTSSGEKLLPEIISFYNSTKGGVDVVDKLSAQYSVARDTNRWPLVLFFTLLNVAGINSFVIYSLNSGKENKRRMFLKNLAHELVKPQIVQRSSIRILPFNLRQNMQQYLGVEQDFTDNDNSPKCVYCPKKKNRYTKTCCIRCPSKICSEHTIKVCYKCFEKISNFD